MVIVTAGGFAGDRRIAGTTTGSGRARRCCWTRWSSTRAIRRRPWSCRTPARWRPSSSNSRPCRATRRTSNCYCCPAAAAVTARRTAVTPDPPTCRRPSTCSTGGPTSPTVSSVRNSSSSSNSSTTTSRPSKSSAKFYITLSECVENHWVVTEQRHRPCRVKRPACTVGFYAETHCKPTPRKSTWLIRRLRFYEFHIIWWIILNTRRVWPKCTRVLYTIVIVLNRITTNSPVLSNHSGLFCRPIGKRSFAILLFSARLSRLTPDLWILYHSTAYRDLLVPDPFSAIRGVGGYATVMC